MEPLGSRQAKGGSLRTGMCALAVFLAGIVHCAAAEPVQIRFWHFFDAHDWVTVGGLVDEFNRTHPDIEVLPEYQGGHALLTRKILAAIVAGVPPEVSTVGCAEISRMAATGFLVPVELSPAERDDVYPAIQRAYTYKDKLWALPIEGTAYALFYNKRLFREAGLPLRAPETWDELIAFGRKLTTDTDGDGQIDRWGFILNDREFVGNGTIFNLYFANDAKLLSDDGNQVLFDTPEVVEVLRLWRDLAYRHRITTPNMPANPILTQRVAMWIGGSWSYGELADTIEIGTGPIPPLRRYATLAGPDAVVVARSTPAKEAASLAFLKWLTAPEQFARLCVDLGSLPIRKSIADVPVYREYAEANPEKAAMGRAMVDLCMKPMHPAWTEMQEAMHKAREKMQQNTASPEEAAAQAQTEAQYVLDSYNRELRFRENGSSRRWFNFLALWIVVGMLVLLGRRIRGEFRSMIAQRQRIDWAAYGLILPSLLLFLAFDAFPIGYAVYLSFFQWDMLSPSQFVGLGNYIRMVADPDLAMALLRTLFWVVGTVPVTTALALGLALLLNARLPGIGLFRVLFYSPSVTSAVAVAVAWWWILNGHNGLLNRVLDLTGLQVALDWTGTGRIDWLNDPRFALLGLIVMEWWRSLPTFLIFLAGLQGIPQALYEAARIDGAGRWAQFRSITWPLLMPATFFVVITTIISAFQVFDQIYIITSGDGGPAASTTTATFYLYKNAFAYFRMGYSSAIACLMGVLIFGVTLAQQRYMGKDMTYE